MDPQAARIIELVVEASVLLAPAPPSSCAVAGGAGEHGLRALVQLRCELLALRASTLDADAADAADAAVREIDAALEHLESRGLRAAV